MNLVLSVINFVNILRGEHLPTYISEVYPSNAGIFCAILWDLEMQFCYSDVARPKLLGGQNCSF